jgi:hypothetical protein
MPLTPEERKKKLGFGGLKKVARRTRRTEGHVSQVNSEKRPDPVVQRAITRDITKKHPDVNPSDIWPQSA